MNILIKDCIVLPMTAAKDAKTKYFRGNIGIENDRIAMVTDREEVVAAFERKHAGALRVIDGKHMLAMPGLINLHCHVSMTLMRSCADDIPLMRWLNDYIWPFESKLTGDDIYEGAKLGIAEMLLGGITSFVDMYWHAPRVAQAVVESGIRGVVCSTFMDHNYDAFAEETVRLVEEYRNGAKGRVDVMVAPHAPYSCSPDVIRKAMSLADKYSLGVHTHISETRDEQRTIKERYGMSPTRYLERLGVFEHPVIAAHCVYVDETDMSLLSKYGATAVHNPQSNQKLASGVAPVVDMLKAGVNVGLGTDGTCSNNDLDMWDEMRSASFVQKVTAGNPCVLPAYDMLWMATRAGAEAIGRGDSLGAIEEGCIADIILIDTDKPHLYPQNDMVANLVYCCKASDVDTVIVGGELVVEGRKVANIDIGESCRKVQEITDRILS